MGFVGNLSFFAATKYFVNRSRTDKVTAMVRVAHCLNAYTPRVKNNVYYCDRGLVTV